MGQIITLACGKENERSVNREAVRSEHNHEAHMGVFIQALITTAANITNNAAIAQIDVSILNHTVGHFDVRGKNCSRSLKEVIEGAKCKAASRPVPELLEFLHGHSHPGQSPNRQPCPR